MQCRGPEWIQAEHFERVASPWQRRLDFQHRTGGGDRGVAGELGVQRLGKTFTWTSNNEVRFTDEALRRQPELVERRRVDEVHRRAQRDA